MATEKQVLASRRNGLKGGVKTPEGKAISRLNARKHGIFAAALTPEDSEEVADIEDQFVASLRPVGRVEETLVEKLALTYLRMQRCARAEAEYHIQTWQKPNKILEAYRWEALKRERSCGGRAVAFKEQVFERMVKLFDLYDARLTNQFLKLLHEIERQQRLRKGQDVPPPIVADVTVQADGEAVCSAPVRASQEAPDEAPEGATTNSRAMAPDGAPMSAEAPAPAHVKSQDDGGPGDNGQRGFEKANLGGACAPQSS